MIEDNCKAANGSFVYYLHERDVFDTDAFAGLPDCINYHKSAQGLLGMKEGNDHVAFICIVIRIVCSTDFYSGKGRH